MEYPHKTIHLNGRSVSIKKIIDETITGTTPFEESTLVFIKNWLIGKQRFQLKTSGSTGAPKSITATRNQLIQSARLTLQALSIKRGGKILLCINPAYIGGKMMLVRALVNAMRIDAVDPTSMAFDKIPTCDFAAFVPIQIQSLRKSKGGLKNLSKIKNIIIGGAPLNKQDSAFLAKSKTNSYATYGMTETLSHIALKKISPVLETSFHPLPTIKITTDERSCLVIKAPFLRNKTITNDVVEIDEKGLFKWLGRFDTIINTGGVKVIPEQLEIQIQQTANKLAIRNQFYIIGVPDKKLGEKIMLVLEGNKLAPTLQKLFLMQLKADLPRYHAPKKIRYVQHFTVVNNKVRRE